jgi:transcriptional regulator with XRE-family HTH domain
MMTSVSDSQAQESADSHLGSNARRLREIAGITQVDLARAMTKSGWQWHQSTVARVESGQQSLRFTEAEALVGILGATLSDLTWTEPEMVEFRDIVRVGRNLRSSYEEAARKVHFHLDCRDRASATIAQHEGSPYQRVVDACRELKGDVEQFTLEAALQEGIHRHEAQ